MPVVDAEQMIRGPRAPIFALMQDYYLRLEWDPFVREIRFMDGATESAAGVRVRVRAKNRLTMEVEYVTVDAPERAAVRMTRGPFFFASFAATWIFDEVAATSTRVRFRYSFKLRPQLLAPLLEPVISAVLRRDLRERLHGLKTAVETTDLLERVAGPVPPDQGGTPSR